MESRIWSVVSGERRELGRSRADVRCVTERIGPARIGCVAFDGTRARVLAVDPRGRRVTPVATLDAPFYAYARLTAGWLSGWYDDGPIAIGLDTGQALRLQPARDEAVQSIAANGRTVGGSSSSGTRRPSAFIGSTRPEPGLLLAEPPSMPWEILLGRAVARCVYPAAAWRVASARGRAALVGAYFGAGYAVVLAALLAS